MNDAEYRKHVDTVEQLCATLASSMPAVGDMLDAIHNGVESAMPNAEDILDAIERGTVTALTAHLERQVGQR